MKKQVVIYGAGGLGREILSMLRSMDEWEAIGFFDDGKEAGTVVAGLPVMGDLKKLLNTPTQISVILAMGNPQVKMKLAQQLQNNSLIYFPVLIHPKAIIQDSENVLIGEGSIITAGSIITTEVKIGKHVLLNLNCTIGHEVSIASYSSIMPGVNIAGEVTIGEATLIGSGALVLNGLKIGANCRVGAGAVVTHNVMEGSTVVGVPARPMQIVK